MNATSRNEGSPPRISVVVPALDEAAGIASTLQSVLTARDVELVVADGGSQDATVAIARSLGARVVATARGRAQQMNAGAALATAPVLLFLHADTRLPPRWDEHVLKVLARPRTVAGAFRLSFDRSGKRLSCIAWVANVRSRWLQLPYGDQALFVRADTFRDVGGFEDVPIMEDVRFVRSLAARGRIALCDASVETSARRWVEHGIARTTFVNGACLIAHSAGVSPRRIARFRGRRARNSSVPHAGPAEVFVSPRRRADLG